MQVVQEYHQLLNAPHLNILYVYLLLVFEINVYNRWITLFNPKYLDAFMWHFTLQIAVCYTLLLSASGFHLMFLP